MVRPGDLWTAGEGVPLRAAQVGIDIVPGLVVPSAAAGAAIVLHLAVAGVVVALRGPDAVHLKEATGAAAPAALMQHEMSVHAMPPR